MSRFGVWVFSAVRHEGREYGTAVLSRVDGDRRRIYTARYVLALKGKERGKFEASVLEVGSGTGAPTKTTKPPSPAQGRRRK